MSFCPIPTGGGAFPIVEAGWNDFRNFALVSLNGALAQAETLTNFDIIIPNPSVTFSIPETIGEFQAPQRPTPPDVEISIPTAVPVHGVGPIADPDYGTAPTFTGTVPTIVFDGKPSAFNKTFTDLAPDIVTPVIPTAPIVTLPDVPVLRNITIPISEVVTLPLFTSVAPVLTAVAPLGSFEFTEELYSSANLTKIENKVSAMIDGGTGLPADIELLLFDRGRARNEEQAEQSVRTALEEWSSRGFSLPSGVVDEQARRIRQANRDATNALNRDLTIQFHEKEIEQINFAVVQGISLENILIRAHLTVEQRRFEALKFILEANIAIFNAKISGFNAEVQAYEADVRVFTEQIRAELVKIEIFKSEIEAQQLINEINAQDVSIYEAQVRAANTVVEVFKSEVEAVRSIVDINRTQLEAFRASIEAFTAEVRAKTAEFEAWEASIRGEVAKLGSFEFEVRAFAEEVRAFSAQGQAFRFEQQGDIEREQLLLGAFTAKIEHFRSAVDAERTRISANAQLFDGEARIYAAAGAVASEQQGADERKLQLAIARERSRTDVELRNTSIAATNALNSAQLAIQALDGAAKTYGLTASAALSAVNLSASISADDNNSTGCTTTFTVETAE